MTRCMGCPVILLEGDAGEDVTFFRGSSSPLVSGVTSSLSVLFLSAFSTGCSMWRDEVFDRLGGNSLSN